MEGKIELDLVYGDSVGWSGQTGAPVAEKVQAPIMAASASRRPCWKTPASARGSSLIQRGATHVWAYSVALRLCNTIKSAPGAGVVNF